jgi:hypothetical protein
LPFGSAGNALLSEEHQMKTTTDIDDFTRKYYGLGEIYYDGHGEGVRITPETIPAIQDGLRKEIRSKLQTVRQLRRGDCSEISQHDADNFGPTCIGNLLSNHIHHACHLLRHFRQLCPGQQLALF